MPIIIKEIQVRTSVEKKVVLPAEITEDVYEHIKEKVMEELLLHERRHVSDTRKKER
ncbi:hypothetical protein [Phocaeicola dorei]|uniref:hypothetical protein n=1 Tax=Phocaeicola dorei TaxID=357276 RepID=UPI0018769541|nr:hypothetical protein [Phocaeicola dorei]MBE5080247.1 hypothetical protein [Phocaeicola dorei]